MLSAIFKVCPYTHTHTHTLKLTVTPHPPSLSRSLSHKHTTTSCSWILVYCLFIPVEGHLLLLELVCVCTEDMGVREGYKDVCLYVCLCVCVCGFCVYVK